MFGGPQQPIVYVLGTTLQTKVGGLLMLSSFDIALQNLQGIISRANSEEKVETNINIVPDFLSETFISRPPCHR